MLISLTRMTKKIPGKILNKTSLEMEIVINYFMLPFTRWLLCSKHLLGIIFRMKYNCVAW